MLSFATDFPVGTATDGQRFIASVRNWLLDSPHAVFTNHDLEVVTRTQESVIASQNQTLNCVNLEVDGHKFFSIQHVIDEGDIRWSTNVSFWKNDEVAWVGVRIDRESDRTTVNLPVARKPIIVQRLVSELGQSCDGEVELAQNPHYLKNDDVGYAARLILGQAGCHLPVVYLSATFGGRSVLDAGALASDLVGMAHVVVEPNRPFLKD